MLLVFVASGGWDAVSGCTAGAWACALFAAALLGCLASDFSSCDAVIRVKAAGLVCKTVLGDELVSLVGSVSAETFSLSDLTATATGLAAAGSTFFAWSFSSPFVASVVSWDADDSSGFAAAVALARSRACAAAATEASDESSTPMPPDPPILA